MARKKGKEIICPLTGIKCDSKEEMYFIWWMHDLKVAGYIKDFKRSKSYILSDKEYYRDTVDKSKDKVLLSNHIYTPDFVILWDQMSFSKFFCFNDDVNIKNIPFLVFNKTAPISIIEIKGQINQRWDKTGSLKAFSINQKWMYREHEIYVQMIEIQQLFRTTFTPIRYLATDSGRQGRKINWKVRNYQEYVRIRENV